MKVKTTYPDTRPEFNDWMRYIYGMVRISLAVFLVSCSHRTIQEPPHIDAKLISVKKGARATDTLHLVSAKKEAITFVYHWYREGSVKWKIGEWYTIWYNTDNKHASIKLK